MHPILAKRWVIAFLLACLLTVTPSKVVAARLDATASLAVTDLLSSTPLAQEPPAVGDPVPRIVCQQGVEAFVYATGLKSPGALAIDPSGIVHVAEENRGRVSRINSDRSLTPVVTGLNYPEGIAFDPAGNLYVVEDVENGRLIRIDAKGRQTVLVSGLDAPEGVVWTAGDYLYVTESNVQFVENLPWDVISGVTQVTPQMEAAEVFTDTLLWSYSGITLGADDLLYVANEASNVGTTDSIFQVDPVTGERKVFASDLTAVEGLHFSPGGGFPLFATEEDLGDGTGRLNLVEADGTHRVLCTGFRSPEGVVANNKGNIYVTDQTMIVEVIAPDLVPPGPPEQLVADPPNWTASSSFALAWNNPVDSSGIAGAYLKLGMPPTGRTDGAFYAGENLTELAGISVAEPGTLTVYLWLEDAAGNADHTSTASATLYHDPDAPDSPLDLHTDPGSWSAANQFALNWTNPAEISGVRTACYRLGTPPVRAEDNDGCQAGLEIHSLTNVTVPDSGEHTAYVWLGDAAGNIDPATATSTRLRHDAVPPLSRADAPASTQTAPIQVTWAATDTHGGLESVALWVKKGDAGTWMDSGQIRQTDNEVAPGTTIRGSFLFQPSGQSAYYFAARAVDQAGNTEAEPTGSGDAKTLCETWQRAYLPLLWKANP